MSENLRRLEWEIQQVELRRNELLYQREAEFELMRSDQRRYGTWNPLRRQPRLGDALFFMIATSAVGLLFFPVALKISKIAAIVMGLFLFLFIALAIRHMVRVLMYRSADLSHSVRISSLSFEINSLQQQLASLQQAYMYEQR